MGAINTIDQVVNHPQVQARGMIVESEHPVAGKVKLVGVPVKLSETPGSVSRRASAAACGETSPSNEGFRTCRSRAAMVDTSSRFGVPSRRAARWET